MTYLDPEQIPPCERCKSRVGYRAVDMPTSRRMQVSCENCGTYFIGKPLDKKWVIPTPEFGDVYFNEKTCAHWIWNGVRWHSARNFNRSMQELCKLSMYAFSEWELRLLRVVDA